MQPQPLTTAGVDVSKAELVACILPVRQHRTFRNTAAGCKALCTWLKGNTVERVAFEPTGGHERRLHAALAGAALPAWRVNPRRSKCFGESMGRLDKTDPQDAEVLAEYAATRNFRVTPLPDPATARLRALLRARGRVQKAMHALRNAACMALGDASMALRASEKLLARQLSGLERLIQSASREESALSAKIALLDTLPGVGRLTAAQIAAELPELGELSRGSSCRLAGVTPARRQSGETEKHAHIKGGRPRVRYALYMPTWTAIKWNTRLKRLYERLLAAGKPKKVAMIACMHKLLIWADALLRTGKAWDPARVR